MAGAVTDCPAVKGPATEAAAKNGPWIGIVVEILVGRLVGMSEEMSGESRAGIAAIVTVTAVEAVTGVAADAVGKGSVLHDGSCRSAIRLPLLNYPRPLASNRKWSAPKRLSTSRRQEPISPLYLRIRCQRTLLEASRKGLRRFRKMPPAMSAVALRVEGVAADVAVGVAAVGAVAAGQGVRWEAKAPVKAPRPIRVEKPLAPVILMSRAAMAIPGAKGPPSDFYEIDS